MFALPRCSAFRQTIIVRQWYRIIEHDNNSCSTLLPVQGSAVVRSPDGGRTETASSVITVFEEANASGKILGDLKNGGFAAAHWSSQAEFWCRTDNVDACQEAAQ